MIDLVIITGFLGSGKTTLLKNILHHQSSSKRIAIIQNEFAPSGMDGKELKEESSDFKLVEINNGSVFCVCQLSNFIQTLQQIILDYTPELIFLESSGLADPINVAELLQASEVKDKISLKQVITVVDAPNFIKGMGILPRFRHQVMVADLIVLNKEDLYDESWEKITNSIYELNPFAEIVITSYSKVKLDLIAAFHTVASLRFKGSTSAKAPGIKAAVLRTHQKISRKGLLDFIDKLAVYSIRIKGFIRLDNDEVAALQFVFNRLELKDIDYSGPTEVIAFGEKLDVQFLRKLFKKYAS